MLTHSHKEQSIIKNLSEYRDLLKEGQTEFDFSELDINYEDIQRIDLSNLGLNINLQKIFFPFSGSKKDYNNIFSPLEKIDDDFIYLNNSNLKGNNVIGELTNAIKKGRSTTRVCTFIYSDGTFDDVYKETHPQYFLDKNAPSELREKYYNPFAKTGYFSTFSDPNGNEEKTLYFRQPLTFEDFLQYYQFLHGKYIDRFKISKLDYSKIKLVEALGLEKTRETFENLKILNIDPIMFLSPISSMSLEEIQLGILGNNESKTSELLNQVNITIKAQEKVLKQN